MKKSYITLLVVLSILALFVFPLLQKDRYTVLENAQTISGNWKIEINKVEPSRAQVNLKNTSSGVVTEVLPYLLYTSSDALKGRIYSEAGIDYLVVRYDNEGSNDTLYYTVFRLSENSATKVKSDNFIWACSDPIKKGNTLTFYADTLSQDMDCFFLLSNNFLFKKKISTVTLQ